MFGDDDITPFDWESEFPEIFKNGGFDCIIGNPPYIRIQEMQEWAPKAVELYKILYESGSSKNYDIYVVFIEKALQLINQNGISGFILPNKFMQQEYGEVIRKNIAEGKHVFRIVNFKDFQVFKGATTYTCLLFLTKKPNVSFKYSESSNESMSVDFSEIETSRLSAKPWILHGSKELSFFDRLDSIPKLGDICDNIFVGIQTSADKVFILDYISETKANYKLYSKSLEKEVVLEKTFLRHIISGVDVKKYRIPPIRQYVIFPYTIENSKSCLVPKKVFESDAPKTWQYLLDNKKVLETRESGKFKDNEWYRFGRNQNIDKQHWAKICVPRLVKEIQAIYDENGKWCLDNVDVGGVILKKEYSHIVYYVLGVLNSKILTNYLSKISTPFRGGFWSCNRQYLEQLPIYIPKREEGEKFALYQKIEEMVKNIILLKKDDKNAKDTEFLEKKIDDLVETIYSV